MAWKPDAAHLAWTQNLIRMARDGAIWAAPAMGAFVIDKTNKRLRMVDRAPRCDEELLRQTKVAFAECGYQVVDETPTPPTTPTRSQGYHRYRSGPGRGRHRGGKGGN